MIFINFICINIFVSEEKSISINLNKDLDLDLNFPVLNIMSENYLDGTFQKAYKINCSLSLDQPSVDPKEISVAIYDFAPFASSEEYCLYINPDVKPLVCSGAKTFQSFRGPFASRVGWKFGMTLKTSASYLPLIRFWIAITSKYFSYL